MTAEVALEFKASDGLAMRGAFTKSIASDTWVWTFLALINAAALSCLFLKGYWLIGKDGHPLVHDYLAFWAAGKRIYADQAALLYDWNIQSQYEAQLVGTAAPIELYILYPPHFLFTITAFAWLPYLPASLLFLLVSIAGYSLSLRLIVGDWQKAAIISIAGGGAFYCLWWVQNGFLTAALLSAGVALLGSQPILAGIFLGLLTIKPQLGLLIPIALLASRNWRTITSATCTFLSVALAAELYLGTGMWARFIESLFEASEFLGGGNLWFKQQSLFAIMLPMLGTKTAWAVHIAFALLVGVIVFDLWRREGDIWAKSGALISASLLVSPYLYPYDAVSLTAAAAMILYRTDSRLSAGERLAAFTCCVLPMGARVLFSAAVPLAALGLLFLSLRISSRISEATPENAAIS